ncbi:uncharacterized protein [Lolium perenne]|uniref:uncharacterized protein isoform X2 n=1 Tax=Lolium perenne TaxID=4522 RepID=UPI0021F68427|nr:uncharacterized protein LOC127306378 isoform X2 [Lolium perenne]
MAGVLTHRGEPIWGSMGMEQHRRWIRYSVPSATPLSRSSRCRHSSDPRQQSGSSLFHWEQRAHPCDGRVTQPYNCSFIPTSQVTTLVVVPPPPPVQAASSARPSSLLTDQRDIRDCSGSINQSGWRTLSSNIGKDKIGGHIHWEAFRYSLKDDVPLQLPYTKNQMNCSSSSWSKPTKLEHEKMMRQY